MTGRFEGKVALVTGGSRGIGLVTARRFIADGGRVVLADIREEAGEAATAELGDAAAFVRLDVAKEADWLAAMEEVESRFGGLDVLVNCAGIFWMRSIKETTPEDFDLMCRINQLGTFIGIRSAIAPMRRRGGGVIVNLSSTAGLSGYANTIAYGAAKWAVRGMTHIAANELAADKIRVVSVYPGVTDTPMNQEALGAEGIVAAGEMNPTGRAAQPEEIAGMITWLASDEAGFCTGSEFIIDGGSTA